MAFTLKFGSGEGVAAYTFSGLKCLNVNLKNYKEKQQEEALKQSEQGQERKHQAARRQEEAAHQRLCQSHCRDRAAERG